MLAVRFAVLGEREFRRFYLGYATSLLGTAASPVAVAFAVLASGGTAAELGYVLAAGIAPQVISLVGGGVAADRIGRRRVMLAADAVRACAQAALAVALFAGRPPIWLFLLTAVVRGGGEGFFRPALSGLTVELCSAPGAPDRAAGDRAAGDRLGDANALLGVAQSATGIAGPALAGLLVAVAGPAMVVALDAVSYGISVLALSLLRTRPAAGAAGSAFLADLAEGWREFRSRGWLVATTVQFTLFNLLTWGPFLVLGPVLARSQPGGAAAWGATMACYGGGSVLGGLIALGRRPARPVLAAEVATFGFALPVALLALGAPMATVAVGAAVAGAGSALGGAFENTVMQRQIPARALARVSGLQAMIAFSFGPLAFAAAGPAAQALGARPVLAFGAAWSVVCTAVVLALPAVRGAANDWAKSER